jgi:hypothetical protein
MAVFVNSTKRFMTIIGYRKDGNKFKQDAPEIPPGEARYINNDHYGDTEWYVAVAYQLDATIPSKIGVDSEEGVSFNINGINVPSTTYFSNSLAAVNTKADQLWQVKENDEGDWGFVSGGDYSSDTLHGW